MKARIGEDFSLRGIKPLAVRGLYVTLLFLLSSGFLASITYPYYQPILKTFYYFTIIASGTLLLYAMYKQFQNGDISIWSLYGYGTALGILLILGWARF